MHFEVKCRTGVDTAGEVDVWTWRLVLKGGEVICRSPSAFMSEPEARSQLAAAKTSMRGAGRCKVITVEKEISP